MPPVAAVVEDTFAGEANCTGLAMDDDFYYTACGTGEALVRVDRITGAVTLITTAFDLDVSNNFVYGDDVDADGTADFLYFKGGLKQVGFVCAPAGASPYVGVLAPYGTGTSVSTYGLGYDPISGTLYAFDDGTEQIVTIQ